MEMVINDIVCEKKKKKKILHDIKFDKNNQKMEAQIGSYP